MAKQGPRGISWTDQTWSPIRGCSRVSQACVHCYAERVAARFSGPGQPYEGLARMTPAGPRWTGKVQLVEEHLLDPLRWKRPRRIFVNSMSDLFHEALNDEQIDVVFAVMAMAPEHTFQVLTKRPERMLAYLSGIKTVGRRFLINSAIERVFESKQLATGKSFPRFCEQWPLPNVWLGVSVEDQATADVRIPLLLQTPAAVRWVSAEPLLGPVDLHDYLAESVCGNCGYMGKESDWESDPDGGTAHCPKCDSNSSELDPEYGDPIDWVVAGGESGPGARPMHPDWARSLRDQCRAAGVAYFFKQWGEWAPGCVVGDNRRYATKQLDGDGVWFDCADDWATERDGGEILYRVGKRAAGDLLDGRQWHEYPG